jgi:hypothetical protein
MTGIVNPQIIDTQLATLWMDGRNLQAKIDRAIDAAHRCIGEKPVNVTRKGQKLWARTDDEAIKMCRELAAQGPEKQPWDRYHAPSIIKDYDRLTRELAAVDAETEKLDAVYQAHQWPRFFLVNAANGHIHSSRNCSTCYPTTDYGWRPELSGKTEKDAVETLGTILCSVCYPSAPVAWTAGRPKKAHCPGRVPVEGSIRRTGMRQYGTCPECNSRELTINSGHLRKHKPLKKDKS